MSSNVWNYSIFEDVSVKNAFTMVKVSIVAKVSVCLLFFHSIFLWCTLAHHEIKFSYMQAFPGSLRRKQMLSNQKFETKAIWSDKGIKPGENLCPSSSEEHVSGGITPCRTFNKCWLDSADSSHTHGICTFYRSSGMPQQAPPFMLKSDIRSMQAESSPQNAQNTVGNR